MTNINRFLSEAIVQESFEKSFPYINAFMHKIKNDQIHISDDKRINFSKFFCILKSFSTDLRLLYLTIDLESQLEKHERKNTSSSYYRFKDGYIYSDVDFETILLELKSFAISICQSIKKDKELWKNVNMLTKFIPPKEIKQTEDLTLCEFIESAILKFLFEHIEWKLKIIKNDTINP